MSRLGTTVSTMDTSEAIARQITAELRAALESAGLSQREAAAATGIPLVTLNRRLSGQHKTFDLVEVAALAELVGLGLTDLVLRAERNLIKAAA